MRTAPALSIILLACILLPASSADSRQKHHRKRPVKADVTVKKISKKDIPAEVMKAFTETYPTAEIKGQQKQVSEKVAFYQIESVDSGKTLDVLFQSDGVIVEVAESVEESQLPENIRQALKEKYPGGKITNAECVTRGTHIEYEVALQVGKSTKEVVVNLAGKVFTVK
jgi:hypothetical protein